MRYLLTSLLFTSLAWGTCRYRVATPELSFTGYKFTEKTGVSGRFQTIEWAFIQEGPSLSSILASSSVWIDSHSIDAGNTARNKNITKGLFRNLGGRTIRGLISQMKGDKLAHLKLFMGEREVSLPLTVTDDKRGHLTLKGSLDLVAVGFQQAFSALEKICRSLHRGKDGKSKTWPVVNLVIKATYTKECSP